MRLVEAKKLKKQSVVYVKGTLEKFLVNSVIVTDGDVWVYGTELGGPTKKHYTQLRLNLPEKKKKD